MALTKSDCLARDKADPLAPFRERFTLPEGIIYLDGNSLGALPKAAAARVAKVVAGEWGTDLIKSWNLHHWFDLPLRTGAKVARLIGAKADEVAVTDSTSVMVKPAASSALAVPPVA